MSGDSDAGDCPIAHLPTGRPTHFLLILCFTPVPGIIIIIIVIIEFIFDLLSFSGGVSLLYIIITLINPGSWSFLLSYIHRLG